MLDLIAIALDHKPAVAGLILLLALIGFLIIKMFNGIICFNKVLNQVGILEGKVENMHEGCHIPTGAIKALEDRIHTVETDSMELKVDVKGIAVTLQGVAAQTSFIYNHFTKQGIEATNRRPDDKH